MSAVIQMRSRADRRAQNLHMVESMEHALDCLEALVRDGFTVLRIEIERARPVVWIQACALCDRLSGAWYRIEGGPAGRTYTWQASLLGCHVKWTTDQEAA